MKSKKYLENKAKVDSKKLYTIDEAVALLKTTSSVKFDATVEMHANCGIDTSKGEQQIRSTISLPHGTGKAKKIAAFVDANHEKEAREASADFVYDDTDIKKIKETSKIEFDIAVATPAMMPKLAVIAKVLGPKGLMPNPKTDTVSEKIGETIKALKKGKQAFKNDETGNIHIPVGKLSMTAEQLKENITAAVEAIRKTKPSSSKGVFLKSVALASTMGPGIKINVS